MQLPAVLVPTRPQAERLSVALGWLSLGLGAIELASPGALARSIGLPRSRTLLRGLGMREVAAGIGIFGTRSRIGRSLAVWARVAGDVMDFWALGPALSRHNPKRDAAMAAVAVVAAVTVIDVLCAVALSEDD